MNLLNAFHAQGYGAIWLTGGNAYDPEIARALGLRGRRALPRIRLRRLDVAAQGALPPAAPAAIGVRARLDRLRHDAVHRLAHRRGIAGPPAAIARARVFGGRHRQHGAGLRPAAAADRSRAGRPTACRRCSPSACRSGCWPIWLTQLLIRPALLEVLPDGAYARLRAALRRARRASCAPGCMRPRRCWSAPSTHLVWDGFTHENARGVRMLPVLTDYGPEMAGHPLHLYRWLQYGSSVLAWPIVLAALLVWLRHAPTPRRAAAAPHRLCPSAWPGSAPTWWHRCWRRRWAVCACGCPWASGRSRPRGVSAGSPCWQCAGCRGIAAAGQCLDSGAPCRVTA